MTEEELKSRCQEDGDCWIWQGIASKGGVPKINVHCGRGKNGRSVLSARRVVWEALKGPIPEGKYITPSCGQPGCLNPEHLVYTTKAKIAAQIGARPDVKAKKAAAGAGERSHRAILTRAQVAEIRATSESPKKLAAMYGCSPSSIGKARRGETWQDYTNPFAGLGG